MVIMIESVGLQKATILLPRGIPYESWAVIACDQYTAEPAYWEDVERLVGDAPSTLRLTLPERYLGEPDAERRQQAITATMRAYVKDGLFQELPDSLLYCERVFSDGRVRRGLIGAVDLEAYDFRLGAASLIRATEGTVLGRLPPRVKVRRDALLELPHVMLLMDDIGDLVFGPLSGRKEESEKQYDFKLMMGGGTISKGVFDALSALKSQAAAGGKAPLLLAVGDGNHSLAAAKQWWETLKPTLPPAERERHPARYALAEICNLHEPSLQFEPIHRTVFGVAPPAVMAGLVQLLGLSPRPVESAQSFVAVEKGEQVRYWITTPLSALTVGSLQMALDALLPAIGGTVDYIHGDDVAVRLSRQPDTISFLLPSMRKEELFPSVIQDGALPRKTFSMGHAEEKRYYLEARRIRE